LQDALDPHQVLISSSAWSRSRLTKRLGRTVGEVTAVHDMNLVSIWVSKVSAVVPSPITGTLARWAVVSTTGLDSSQVSCTDSFNCGRQKSDHASVSYGCCSAIERHINVEAG
jgi:hypothetical protein